MMQWLEKHGLNITILALIIGCGAAFANSINPGEKSYRVSPKVGDVYFLDYHQLSNKPEEYAYPIRMAKLVRIDQQKQTIVLKLSSWTYKRLWDAQKDYFIQRDFHNSYYWKKDYSFPLAALSDHSIVQQVRRRIGQIDVESAQQITEFKKDYYQLPNI